MKPPVKITVIATTCDSETKPNTFIQTHQQHALLPSAVLYSTYFTQKQQKLEYRCRKIWFLWLWTSEKSIIRNIRQKEDRNAELPGCWTGKCPMRSLKYSINIIRGSHIVSIQYLRILKRNEQKLIRNAVKVHGALPNQSGIFQGQWKEQTCDKYSLQDIYRNQSEGSPWQIQ